MNNVFKRFTWPLYHRSKRVVQYITMEVPTGEVTIVIKNDISGDPKRDAFMDEGEFAEQAFEVQVTSKVTILQCQIMLNKIIW